MRYFKLNLLSIFLILPSFALSEITKQYEMLAEPETGYISDEFYVPLRSSPCATCKIVHRGLKTGTKLTILGFDQDWNLVTTESGYKGWVRIQHLSKVKIARAILAENANEIEGLRTQNRRLELDMQDSFELIEGLRAKIISATEQSNSLTKELTNIKVISSKEIALNEQNQLLVKHNHMLQEERDVLRANVNDLQNNKWNQALLYGGFLVFLGAILAGIIPHVRGRKRLSEWH